MRINNTNNAGQIQAQARQTEQNIKRKAQPKSDEAKVYTTSQAVSSYSTARKAINNTPDFREALVASISAKIEDGTYDVSSEALADKILSKF